MKRIIFSFLTLLPLLVFGQKAKIDFQETSHHFGTIAEGNGKVSYDFRFKNTGKAPLILTNVRAGCGCTVPMWSNTPILPGGEGSIRVTFDPRQRPGAFIKSITVNSNAENPVVSLTIRGKVSLKPKGPYSNYPSAFGKVKATTNVLNLGTVPYTQIVHKEIEIINTDSKPARLRIASSSPYISADVTPSLLKKDGKGKISISYDANQVNDWGTVHGLVTIEINDKNRYELKIIANIQEDFSQYQDNFESAPQISLPETEATLRELSPNTSYTHDIILQNEGKSELIIRKIKTSHPMASVHLSKPSIKPGKKAKASIHFKTTVPELTQLIQFITNDPVHPTVTYKLTASTKSPSPR